MGTVSTSATANIVITKSVSKGKATKMDSKADTVKNDFNSLLAVKTNKVEADSSPIDDCIKELTTILADLKGEDPAESKSTQENKEDVDKTNDTIALLSSLLNQLTVKVESKELTLNSETSTTVKPSKANNIDLVLKLMTQLQAKIPDVEGKLADTKQNIDMTSIKNVIHELLASVTLQGVDSTLKDQNVKKIEGVLKKLTQVVENVEKQGSINKSVVQTFDKTKFLIKDTDIEGQDSKIVVDSDKILQGILQKDSQVKIKSFANFVNRASSQTEVTPVRADAVKVVDNQSINKDSVATDVIKVVKFMQVNDIKDLTVQITPKELGEVIVKLTDEGNITKATITTPNKEVYQLVNSNLQEISIKSKTIKNLSVQIVNEEKSVFKADTYSSEQVPKDTKVDITTKQSANNVNPFIKDFKETETNSKNLLVDVKAALTDKTSKLENIQKNPNEVVSGQNKDTQNSKTNTVADKVLQKIAQKDNTDNTPNFAHIVNRVNNQNDLAITKVTDNLVVNKNNLTNDVIKTVKFMNTNDIKDLTVKINPKNLGEIVVKLTQEGNVMKATITTSNKETYQLINSNLQEINDKISSNNTSIQSFSVDVFNGEGSFLKQDSQQNNGSGKGKNNRNNSIIEESEIGIEGISNDNNNLNILV